MLPFSKLNKIIFGYFDPENIFIDNKIINFRGDLTDSSAKKEALMATYHLLLKVSSVQPLHNMMDYLPSHSFILLLVVLGSSIVQYQLMCFVESR